MDGSPDILTNPFRTHQPGLVEETNLAGGVNLAHDMETPFSEGQPLGEVRDMAAHVRGKFMQFQTITHLSGGFAI